MRPHKTGSKSYTLAKTQNPLVPNDRFHEFSILSLDGFMGGDHEELFVSTW